MKETELTKSHSVKNTSNLSVSYRWEIKAKDHTTPFNISQVFDISPLRYLLNPSESNETSFSFYALYSRTTNYFDGFAICHVIGCPDYQFYICGQSVDPEYSISTRHIVIPHCLYNEIVNSAVLFQINHIYLSLLE